MEKVFIDGSDWRDIVGEVYNIVGVKNLLGLIEAAEVIEMMRKQQILYITTDQNITLIPAFQFSEGVILPGISEVLYQFEYSTVSPWTILGWLKCPNTALEGKSVLQWLTERKSIDSAVGVAIVQSQYYIRHKNCV